VKNVLFAATSLVAIAGLFLAARARAPGTALLTAVLALYPLPFYVTFALERYRYPIDPELLLLCALTLTAWWSRTFPLAKTAQSTVQ
jgi:hypothetical protein